MKKIWEIVNSMRLKLMEKNALFLVTVIIINCLLGAFIWFVLGRYVLPGIEWLICFMGYPAVFLGGIGGTIYLYNHEFN